MKRIYFILFISFLLTSCKKSETSLVESEIASSNSISEEKAYIEKLEFGKALAISLRNKDLREIIKTEALKQFDHDYDVLFSNIMNRRLSNEKTVLEFIASNSVKPNELISSITNLPLLNIYVPELEIFSSEKWEITNQIPIVAIVKESDIKAGFETIKAFNNDGVAVNLSYKTQPKTPVIVIKNNERIIINNQSSIGKLASTKTNLSKTINETNYSFLYSDFDNTQPKSKILVKSNQKLMTRAEDPRPPRDTSTLYNSQMIDDLGIRYAYEKQLNSQRDYIYYGLDASTGVDTGIFKQNYTEHIVSIQLGNDIALQKITDNWTEGNLEIAINISFINRTGGTETIVKGLSVAANDLKTIETPRAEQVPGGPPTMQLVFSNFTPIPIQSWDAYKNGNKWKFSIIEVDAGTETTITSNMSSTFSNNFSNSVNTESGDVKYGTTTGSSNSFTNTSTITIKSTDNSDTLYEGYLDFYTPIYTQQTNARPGYIYPKATKIQTGYVNLEVRPIKTY